MSKTKKILALVLVLVMALSLFAGCGNKTENTTGNTTGNNADNNAGNTNAGTGSNGGAANDDRVLSIATSGDTGTLYPLAASGGFVSLLYAFYEPLWTLRANGERVWILAESYEQVDPEGLEHTLKIREGIKFSNGNALTAEDVMFSMEMCKDDPRFYLNVVNIDFEKTKVVDEYTIDVWYPYPSYTQENAFTQLMIMDKESFDMEALSMNPIGTGPYTCTDYVVNSHVTCAARDDYWKGEVGIKNLQFKVITESAQITNALEVGDIDIVNSVAADEVDYIESLGYNVETFFGGYSHCALFSFAGPLATREARYAVSYAMDRESMAYLMYKGLSSVPHNPASEHTVDEPERFNNLHDTYTTGYNVEKAAEYAKQAGLVGKTLKIITNGMENYNDMAAILKENLEAIGVNSEIASYDSATYFGVVMDESNFDIALFYLPSPASLGCDIISSYPEFIPLGWYGAEKDEYTALCAKFKYTNDLEYRDECALDAMKMFVEIDPWYAICESVTINVSNPDVGGVEYYLAGNLYYSDLYWN